jgi:hypothetical protein
MSDQHDEGRAKGGRSDDRRDFWERPALRNSWERPTLRRLAANKAAHGNNPGNDGQGGGVGSNHHS